jgi:nucleotide-binding universal stress UspA family protein
MSFKDILVHLDGGERDATRTAIALGIAGRFGARLTGLFARIDRHGPSVVARRESSSLQGAAEASEQAFTEAATASGVNARFWRLSHGEPGHVLSETAICARFADLVVLGQHQEGDATPAEFVEQLMLQSGRPCLIIPAMGSYPTVGTNVVVAWNGGREATRALHDAMPFIEGATAIEVVTIHSAQRSGPGATVPPVNIRDHLSAHGVTVTREQLAGEDIGVMDLLLSRTFDLGADLLVMGGHGGYHLPFLKGSGTRHILRHMTVPVLMSH